MQQILKTTGIIVLSTYVINNVSSFSTISTSNGLITTQKQSISFVILKSSKSESDDWYEGYDEFVKNLDFESGGWDDHGSVDMPYGERRRGSRREGGGGGRYKGGHDYSRAKDDDTSIYIDTATVERLLAERLKCRKTGEFDRADGIRDELLVDHGVTIWDRERVWTTNRDRRGGSNRHGENGRYGKRSTPTRRRDFGPKGHDYKPVGGPIDMTRCTITTDQIDQLIAERLKFKMGRNFREADAIQEALYGQGIFINDGFKEWRGDGEDWGQSSSSRGKRNKPDGEFRTRDYTHRGPGIGLSSDEKELISGLVAKRAQAKATRDYDLADSIREQLSTDYAVTIDDKKCEWSLINEEYIFSSASPNLLPDDIVENIQNMLADRSIAKQQRDFRSADDIRDSLKEDYGVEIDDRKKEWSVAALDDEEDDDHLLKLGYAEHDEDAEDPIEIKQEVEEESEEVDDEGIVFELEEVASEIEENDAITIESLNSLTVPELKEKLRDVGLPVSGRKSELIERLTANSN